MQGGQPSIGSTSSTLIERVRANDQRAWVELVRLYGPRVYQWCRGAGLPISDAGDVVQDVFACLPGAMANFRHDRETDTFRGWLRTITRKRVLDHYRRQGHQPKAAGGSTAQQLIHQIPDPDVTGSTPDGRTDLLCEALERLTELVEERTFQAFHRTTFDGHAPAEVACDLAMTTFAVYQAKSRSLRLLRRILQDLGLS